MGSRVELFATIRFDWQRNGMSIRAPADKYKVHLRTVRQAIESVVRRRCGSRQCAAIVDQITFQTTIIDDWHRVLPATHHHTQKHLTTRYHPRATAGETPTGGAKPQENGPVPAQPPRARSDESSGAGSG